MESLDFIHVDYPQPHIERRKKILKNHPEIKKLYGHTPSTAVWTVGIIALQFSIAIYLENAAWWLVISAAWIIGAVCEHALFVIIHECTHNLVLKRPSWNKVWGIVANLPGFFPAAIGFRNYHLLHHRDLAEPGWDADIPGQKEAAWVGSSSFRKAFSLFFFAAVQGIIRPLRLKKINVLESWGVINGITSLGSGLLILYFFGGSSFWYLVLSCIFAIGLHPMGGRWIQEHYLFKPGQETYSYYGPLNKLCFNMGYHNEHHDFMMVPWSRLPKIRKIAPEYYDNLFYHTSWVRVLLKFIFDPGMNFFSRIVRPDHEEKESKAMTTQETDSINTFDEIQPGIPSANPVNPAISE
jgi:sphingolipid 4-desaturase/C4-monooxygenase